MTGMLFQFVVSLLLISGYVLASLSAKRTVQNDDVFTFVGRFLMTSTGTQQAIWPSSGIIFNVLSSNTTASVQVNFNSCAGNCKFFVEAKVDCNSVQKYEINPTQTALFLQLNTVVGDAYEIQLRKVTESSNGDAQGIIEFGDINLTGAEFVPTEKAQVLTQAKQKAPGHHNCLKRHNMLVIGDSITAAYGVDGTSPCSFTAATENVDHSYATIVAAEVQAELHVVAWSGRGVVRNYGDVNQMSQDPMPHYYNRTIATVPASADPADPAYWKPTSYPADIVLVMLGTNDYSTQPNPTDEQFVAGLVDLLTTIIRDYPQAKGRIAAMCAPLAAGHQCANIKTGAAQAGVEYVFIDPDTLSGGYGCDGHPNAVTQQLIADVVAPAVKNMLWE